MKIRVLAVIQARMGSHRLPGKILFPIGNKIVLEMVYQQVHQSKGIDHTIVATSIKSDNDKVEQFCRKKSIPFFRGSEADVLSRFYNAVVKFNPEFIVRICADQPFIDSSIIGKVVERHLKSNFDYSTTVGNLPKGIDAEIFSFALLEEAYRKGRTIEEREHVTTYIIRNSDKFKIQRLRFDKKLKRPEISLTLDTKEDYDFLKSIYESLGEDSFSACKIIEAYDSGILKRPNLCSQEELNG